MLLSSLGKLLLPGQLSVLATREETCSGPVCCGRDSGAALGNESAPLSRGPGLSVAVLPFLDRSEFAASSVLQLESRLYLPAVAVASGFLSWPLE